MIGICRLGICRIGWQSILDWKSSWMAIDFGLEIEFDESEAIEVWNKEQV